MKNIDLNLSNVQLKVTTYSFVV